MWRKYGITILVAKFARAGKIDVADKTGGLWRSTIQSRVCANGALAWIIALIAVCAASLSSDAFAAPPAAKLTEVPQGAAIFASEASASKTYCSLMLALHFPQTGCQSMVAPAAPPDREPARTASTESNPIAASSASNPVAATKERRPAQSLLGIIPFMNNSSVLTTNVTATLDKLAVELGRSPGAKLLIMGHANRTGSEEYSKELSRQRADAVAKYLSAKLKSFDPKSITVEPRGTASPLPAFDPADGNQRRVEIYRTH